MGRKDDLRAEIDRTREELGDAVATLSRMTDDVKEQARGRVEDAKAKVSSTRDDLASQLDAQSDAVQDRARQAADMASEQRRPLALAAAVVGAVILFLLLRLSRK
jgi:ElaB/YqjD/DUF883 family membrane-anchored ribosome-binding protein